MHNDKERGACGVFNTIAITKQVACRPLLDMSCLCQLNNNNNNNNKIIIQIKKNE